MSLLYGFAYVEKALLFLENEVPTKVRSQIKQRIEKLAANPMPQGCKKLVDITDSEYPVYRVRQGDYRILYSIRPVIIVILAIGHRKDVYK